MAKEHEPWIEASDVTPMFPTLVWKLQLKADLREAMEARILAALEGIRRDLPRLAPGQGWQSEQTSIFTTPGIRPASSGRPPWNSLMFSSFTENLSKPLW